MTLSPKDAQILQIIVQYCEDIDEAQERFGKTREDFIKDRLFQHACSMALQTIGEASRSFSDAFITAHQEVAWKLIKGMRNFFAHSYHISIDMDKVWMMVHRDIPLLKAYCVNILKENHCDVFRIAPMIDPQGGHNGKEKEPN